MHISTASLPDLLKQKETAFQNKMVQSSNKQNTKQKMVGGGTASGHRVLQIC